MNPRITLLTLGVDDLEKAVRFYRDGLGLKTEGIVGAQFEHGAVAFFELQAGLKLALWPRASLAHDVGVPVGSQSSTEFSIGHNVSSKREVDAVMEQAKRAGARIGLGPDAVGGELDGPAEQRDQPPGHRTQRVLLVRAALGASEMGHQDDARAALDQQTQRGQRRDDPGVVGDHPVGERNVEVRAHQHPPARGLEGAHRLFAVLHRYAIRSRPSTTRFEKPHSLSYQASTLTRVPSSTLVESASKTLLAGLPITSDETMGSSQYSR